MTEMRQMLELRYPREIENKRKMLPTKKTVKILIGNTTIKLREDKYSWTFYLKSAPGEQSLKELVEKVEVNLHHTFQKNKIIITNN